MRLLPPVLVTASLIAGLFGALTAYLPSLGLPDSRLIGLTLNAPAGVRADVAGKSEPIAAKDARLTPDLLATLRAAGVRRVRVKEVLPGFDGRRLDDLVDFLTYTFLPLLLVWRAGLLSPVHQTWLLVPLAASAYGFSQTAAKTDDNYFLGFPSYWNVLAFYLYLLRLPEGWTMAVLLGFAALTFVPARYLHTSAGGRSGTFTNAFAVAWAFAVLDIVWRWQDAPLWLIVASMAFPAYYMAASWIISIRRWRRTRQG